ncbi:BTAD domain-containing putative transcriptional regulator [Nocardiopsis oceani]
MRFGVLGPIAVWTSGGERVRVPGTKVRALLCALLIHEGHPVSVDRLVDALWDGRPPNQSAGALQAKVSRLRKALDQAEPGGRALVEHGPGGYRLAVDPSDVDATRARELLERSRSATDPGSGAEALREALALWRGPAYADVADEGFAHHAAARLEELRLTAEEELAQARLELGEHRLLVGELGDLVERHPLRERLRSAHMLALYRSGRQSEALESYEWLRSHLAEELGLDPGAELTALHSSLLARDASLESPPEAAPGPPRGRTNLPAPLSGEPDGGLVGRGPQIDRVRTLLGSDRLVTLVGPGGVGKTRLAVEALRGISDRFPDGVWMVALGGLGPEPGSQDSAETGSIAEAVAAVLGLREGVPEHAPRERDRRGSAERLCAALRDQRALLLFDTCEHVLDPVSRLCEQLLESSPGVRALATSHEPLGLVDERVHPVPPLDLPESAEEADRSAAVRLFMARAARSSPGFALQEDDREAVAAVCRRLDGIPLALELAATRVRTLGVRELARRLDDRFRVLGRGHRTAPERQRTLRAVMDWSWELLDGDERAVLRRLAVHRGGCTLEAAERVCSGGGVAEDDVLDLVARLSDRSLVVVDEGTAGSLRYRLLESVAAYGLERLAESGEGERVRRAHAEHHTDLAEEAERGLRGHRQREWLCRLDAEAANLRAALDWAVLASDRGADELAVRLAGALGRYWTMRGRLREARRCLASALGTRPEVGRQYSPARLRAMAWRTAVSFLDPVDEDRHDRLTELFDAYAAADDPEGAAHARLLCAASMLGAGDTAVIGGLAEEALTAFRALGNRWGIASALVVRAELNLVGGDLDRCRTDAESALALFREAGDGHGGLGATRILGTLAEIGGRYTTARRLHTDSLRVAEDLGLWTFVSEQLSGLGRLSLLAADFDAAAELHERALRIARERAHGAGAAFAENGLALADRRNGRLDAAEERMQRLVEWNERSGYLPGVALGKAELGFVAELRGDADAARRLHTEGLAAARATRDPRAVALALEGSAGVAVLDGDAGAAARLLGAAAAARESVGAPLPGAERGDVDRISAATAAVLGEQAFTKAFGEGQGVSEFESG